MLKYLQEKSLLGYYRRRLSSCSLDIEDILGNILLFASTVIFLVGLYGWVVVVYLRHDGAYNDPEAIRWVSLTIFGYMLPDVVVWTKVAAIRNGKSPLSDVFKRWLLIDRANFFILIMIFLPLILLSYNLPKILEILANVGFTAILIGNVFLDWLWNRDFFWGSLAVKA